MLNIITTAKLEVFKARHQGFFLTWFALTLMPIIWLLYSELDRNTSDTVSLIVPDPSFFYYNAQTSATMLLALFLPFMASALISKLADNENKTDAWKMLAANNQDMRTLWDVKFLMVYILMEASTLLTYLSVYFFIHVQRSIPIPFGTLLPSVLAVSGVNIVTLTLAQIVSFYFRNQIIALVEGIVGGMVGLISPLMSPAVVRFLPWGYYTMAMLAGTYSPGFAADGKRIWEYYFIEPNYPLIAAVTVAFIAVNLIARHYFTRKEF